MHKLPVYVCIFGLVVHMYWGFCTVQLSIRLVPYMLLGYISQLMIMNTWKIYLVWKQVRYSGAQKS